MYLDPPYPGNKVNYVHDMRDWSDHNDLVKRLNNTTCKWIVSSYDPPEVRELFSQHHITPVQSFSGMNIEKNKGERVVNKEVLITNFLPPSEPPTSLPNALQGSFLKPETDQD